MPWSQFYPACKTRSQLTTEVPLPKAFLQFHSTIESSLIYVKILESFEVLLASAIPSTGMLEASLGIFQRPPSSSTGKLGRLWRLVQVNLKSFQKSSFSFPLPQLKRFTCYNYNPAVPYFATSPPPCHLFTLKLSQGDKQGFLRKSVNLSLRAPHVTRIHSVCNGFAGWSP